MEWTVSSCRRDGSNSCLHSDENVHHCYYFGNFLICGSSLAFSSVLYTPPDHICRHNKIKLKKNLEFNGSFENNFWVNVQFDKQNCEVDGIEQESFCIHEYNKFVNIIAPININNDNIICKGLGYQKGKKTPYRTKPAIDRDSNKIKYYLTFYFHIL